MPDTKFSNLPPNTTPGAADISPIVSSGTPMKAALQDIVTGGLSGTGISNLSAAATPIATDEVPIFSGGGGKHTTIAALVTAALSGNSFQRNKVINGAIAIDQRNNGASITPIDNQYGPDRWKARLSQASKYSLQQIAVAPSLGFTSAFALRATSLSSFSPAAGDFFVLQHHITAENISDLAFGSANARPVAVSFRCRSSTGGTFSGAILNAASTRSIVFSYALAASVVTYVTVPLPPDTSGTWVLSGPADGLFLAVDLGSGTTFQTSTLNVWSGSNLFAASGATKLVGTNAATFDISDVQLETGIFSTPLEQRLFSTELALCLRYFWSFAPGVSNGFFGSGASFNVNSSYIVVPMPVQMRVAPSLAASAVATFVVDANATGITPTAVTLASNPTPNSAGVVFSSAGAYTSGQAILVQSVGTAAFLNFSAEH